MTKLELEMLNSVPSTEFNTFWIPCTWFVNLLREAKQECRITDSNGLKLIMEEFNEFRSKCGLLWSFDWISIPLVYTQVVTLATYAFFGACIFGRQYVETPDKPDHNFELYIPIFTIFQLFFYMGLLKVAEQLINPFGDDDEDFELNWIIDRHMKVSYLGVDLLNTSPPPLVRDNYFYQLDIKLPYTEASVGYKKKTYRGSVARMQIPQEKQNLLVPEFSEDDDEDKIAATLGMGNRGASLWTLVGGQLNTRFSVSNQNLDSVTLESGSNNWRVSNPSLFLGAEGMADGKPGLQMQRRASQLLQVPEGGGGLFEVDQTVPVAPITPRSRTGSVAAIRASGGAFKKAVQKVVRRPRKNKPHNNQTSTNRWVAFQSGNAGRSDEFQVLSLNREQQASSSDLRPVMPVVRRNSFDERNLSISADGSFTSRFQSLPDVKGFAIDKGAAIADEYEDLPSEDQDNLSTANLLVLHEGEEDDVPPQLTFTRASPCPSSGSGQSADLHFAGLHLRPASSITSINEIAGEEHKEQNK